MPRLFLTILHKKKEAYNYTQVQITQFFCIIVKMINCLSHLV